MKTLKDNISNLFLRIDLGLRPSIAFELFTEELSMALGSKGISFTSGRKGHIMQDNFEVARILVWKPGKEIVLEWHQSSWESGGTTKLKIGFEPVDNHTQLTLEQFGLSGLIDDEKELTGWYTSEIVGSVLKTMMPSAMGDWITDRRARKPSGLQAREIYRDPLYHYPNFYTILSILNLTADDHLLEVGCGGGAFLKKALLCGCRATAIDHSPDMVALATRENHEAINSGRLKVSVADAASLPFQDNSFTCATMTGVLGFLPDPVTALAEIRRVLIPAGRMVILGTDPKWKGTPAAPEPMASRLTFFEDPELVELARKAGFPDARIERIDQEKYAREAGIPEDIVTFFKGSDAPFLISGMFK